MGISDFFFKTDPQLAAAKVASATVAPPPETVTAVSGFVGRGMEIVENAERLIDELDIQIANYRKEIADLEAHLSVALLERQDANAFADDMVEALAGHPLSEQPDEDGIFDEATSGEEAEVEPIDQALAEIEQMTPERGKDASPPEATVPVEVTVTPA